MLKQGQRVVPGLSKSLLDRLRVFDAAINPCKGWGRWLASDAPNSVQGGQGNAGEFAGKEDFIDTPLPGVPEDVRKDPQHRWPHQTDKERKEDFDVPDEGENITKNTAYMPHNDPSATPNLKKDNKRSYHTFAVRGVRGLHSSSLFLGEKQPHDEEGESEDTASGKIQGAVDITEKAAPSVSLVKDGIRTEGQSPATLQDELTSKKEEQAFHRHMQPHKAQRETRVMHG